MRKVVCCLVFALLASGAAFGFQEWEAIGIGSHDVRWSGGTGTLAVGGTFGGTTVTFFWCTSLAGSLVCFEVDAAACIFTAAGMCDFFKAPGTLRLVVTGGSSPSIDAVASGPTQASVITSDPSGDDLLDVSGVMQQHNPTGAGGPHIAIDTAGTYVGWVDATPGPLEGGVTFTNDGAGDFLTVPTSGNYIVVMNTSFTADVNRVYICHLHRNSSPDSALIIMEMGNSSSVNSGAGSTTGALTAGDELSVRCTTETDGAGTDDITFYNMVMGVICLDCSA